MVAGAKWVKSTCAQWEEDQERRIAAEADLPTEIDPDRFDAAVRTQDLPANWREQDGAGSFHDAWAEIRRRKTGGV
jgi:hypothetical protein